MAESSTVITLSVKPVVDGNALRKALADELRRVANEVESPKKTPQITLVNHAPGAQC